MVVGTSGALATRFGERIRIVEPYAAALPTTFTASGARLIDIDEAIAHCGVMIVLVDHELFKSVPLDERVDKIVYDTRGIWPDQPSPDRAAAPAIRLAG